MAQAKTAATNPVRGAEPMTDRAEGQGAVVGRTAGATPPTGANSTLAPLASFQLPLNRLPDELGAAFAFLQNRVDPGQRSLGETGRGGLVVDLLPTHASKVDDITYCYKPSSSLASGGIGDIIFASERETEMTYFTQIDPTNTRRFAGPEGQVLAIYDRCRAYTLYAEVGSADGKSVCFVSAPRSYFSDEVSEINSGGWH